MFYLLEGEQCIQGGVHALGQVQRMFFVLLLRFDKVGVAEILHQLDGPLLIVREHVRCTQPGTKRS